MKQKFTSPLHLLDAGKPDGLKMIELDYYFKEWNTNGE
jgi:hypothetical protein